MVGYRPAAFSGRKHTDNSAAARVVPPAVPLGSGLPWGAAGGQVCGSAPALQAWIGSGPAGVDRLRRGILEDIALAAGPCFLMLGAVAGALLWMPAVTVDAPVGVATGSYVVLVLFHLDGLRSGELAPVNR
jgi:hypothetical protein